MESELLLAAISAGLALHIVAHVLRGNAAVACRVVAAAILLVAALAVVLD